MEAAFPCEDIWTNFIKMFADGQNKLRHRLEVEQCVRRAEKDISIFHHRVKRTVDKGWPDDMNGIPNDQQNAERAAQGRKRRQRYMDHSLPGLRPRNLQGKAQECLMEHANANWNDLCTQILQKDLLLEVFLTFLSYEEQTKAEMTTFGQETKTFDQS